MAKVLVEAIAMFRHRYVVETPDDHPEYALDTVVCDEAKEMSQLYLGETISSHRVISDVEYLQMFDFDNEYMSDWSIEQKMDFITKLENLEGIKE